MVQAPGIKRRLTYEDYLRLPETNRRCELLGGFPGVPAPGEGPAAGRG